MPFLFPSYEAADKVLDGPVGQDLRRRFEKAGFVALAFLDNGFRNVTNSKRDVKDPSDLKGMKIRTMEAPTHLAIWRALGANPTPMAWPIFTQLQQGVIDGQETRSRSPPAKLPGGTETSRSRHVTQRWCTWPTALPSTTCPPPSSRRSAVRADRSSRDALPTITSASSWPS